MTVEYLKLEGYPGYIVSNDGKIWSVAKGSLHEVKGRDNGKGYLQVVLYKRAGVTTEKHQKYVHVLIAEAFIGPSPGENYQVNHKNKIRTDCSVANLEWLTDIDNYRHRDGILPAEEYRD